jgi:zinc protease
VRRPAPWFFVVGDVPDPDALAGEIGARFARESTGGARTEARGARWTDEGGEVVEERSKAQTAIGFGFPGPTRGHPDVFPLRVLSNAISGLGGRLFEELRSKRSLAYAVAAYPVARWQGGAYVAYIGTSPEREAEAKQAMVRELLRCAAERLPEDELERSKRYTIGAWQIRRQTNARQLADLADAVLFGAGLEELRDFEVRVRAVSAEDVRAAAERWLDPARLVVGVVRGGARA